MPSTHPLEIRNASGDDCATLMSKGHHSSTAFLAAARAYWDEPLRGFGAPAHSWWRSVPDSTGEYSSRYHEASAHARGAFPVTYICQW